MGYNIRRLDLNALPSCPVTGKDATIPDFPVVYIIFDETQVFYVGASKSPYNRWSAHRSDHRKRTVMRRKDVRVAWITASIEQFCDLESALIRFFRPRFNLTPAGYHHAEIGGKRRNNAPYQRLLSPKKSNGNGHK